ncbi:SCO-spondin-like [Octopus sinensis]|uniref:SCO-spondin-like n=1 Tax=Octopus sinensis TaxID=2607531 RepID=A0A7E6ELZ2_9MOLL|nr:SCO-spondin-like [Octopus sinensis]
MQYNILHSIEMVEKETEELMELKEGQMLETVKRKEIKMLKQRKQHFSLYKLGLKVKGGIFTGSQVRKMLRTNVRESQEKRNQDAEATNGREERNRGTDETLDSINARESQEKRNQDAEATNGGEERNRGIDETLDSNGEEERNRGIDETLDSNGGEERNRGIDETLDSLQNERIDKYQPSLNFHFCNTTEYTNFQSNGSCKDIDLMLAVGYTLVNNTVPKDGGPCYFEKLRIRKELVCCPGWSGTKCHIPLCIPPCKNDGICFAADKCNCENGYVGYRCENKVSDTTSVLKYCFEKSVCYGLGYKKLAGKVVTLADCCSQRNTGSWGLIGRECIKCNYQNSTIGDESLKTDSSCRSEGNRLFRTFDGSFFTLQSPKCVYNLIEFSNFWWVRMTVANCVHLKNCEKTIFVKFGNTIVTIQNGRVLLNGEEMDINGEVKDGVEVSRRYNYIAIQFSAIPIDILMNKRQYVQIVPSDSLFKSPKLRGLCSNYDGNENNDFFNREGDILANSEEFIQAYITPPNKCKNNKLSTSPDDNYPEANKICRVAFTFYNCDLSEKKPVLIDNCYSMIRACDTAEEAMAAACTAIESIAHQCFLIGNDIPKWRNENICPITCPEGFEFDECTAPCPRTCGNIDEISDCDLPCVAACRCPVGKFYENGKCIDKEECPCEYEGRKFDVNSTVKMDCNLCVCKSGKWVCEKQECPGTCTILGRNSIKTFDNLDYTIEPVSCRYTLVQSKSDSPKLKISLEFGPCSSPYLDEFNCSTGLKIETSNLFAKITKKGFFVNDNYRSDNSFFSKEVIIKQASSLFYVVDGLDFRILHYAGAQTYITLKSNYRGLVEGLCGNFDSNINNELVSRTGLLVHKTKFAQEFIAFSCFTPQRDDVESEPCEFNINWIEKEESA